MLVKGHAEVRVVPDRFTIHLTVDVTNMSPDVARKKVEDHMRQLLDALDRDGVLTDKTRASSLSIQPDTSYNDGKSIFNGTDVSRTISATFDSLNKLRAFIAQVPADKEVQISSTDVHRSDIDKVELQLRTQGCDRELQTGRAKDCYRLWPENRGRIQRFRGRAGFRLRHPSWVLGIRRLRRSDGYGRRSY